MKTITKPKTKKRDIYTLSQSAARAIFPNQEVLENALNRKLLWQLLSPVLYDLPDRKELIKDERLFVTQGKQPSHVYTLLENFKYHYTKRLELLRDWGMCSQICHTYRHHTRLCQNIWICPVCRIIYQTRPIYMQITKYLREHKDATLCRFKYLSKKVDAYPDLIPLLTQAPLERRKLTGSVIIQRVAPLYFANTAVLKQGRSLRVALSYMFLVDDPDTVKDLRERLRHNTNMSPLFHPGRFISTPLNYPEIIRSICSFAPYAGWLLQIKPDELGLFLKKRSLIHTKVHRPSI